MIIENKIRIKDVIENMWLITFERFENFVPNYLGELLAILPEIYLILMILLALIFVGAMNFQPVSNILEKRYVVRPALYKFSVVTLWYTLFLCIAQCLFIVKNSILVFADYAISDCYTGIIKIAVILTIILILNSSAISFKQHPRNLVEYPVIILLTTLFLLVLISSYNFITVFLAILGFSLTLYVLLLNNSFNQASREAGIKYFYLSTVSSGLLIGGIFLLYLICNSTGFLEINWLIHSWKLNNALANK
jgi:NADH-quinone oxidoreductase subunit N